MIHDNTSGNLFPGSAGTSLPGPRLVRRPAIELAREALDIAAVRAGDPARLQREIEKVVLAIRPAGHAEERAGDGSLRLSSMNAVFAIALIDKALGGGVLPRLRGRTTPADFRTSATVAALVGRLFASIVAA